MILTDRRAHLYGQYEQFFKNHILHREQDNQFMIRSPGSSSFWSRIVFLPGAIFLYGDVGELVLRLYGKESGIQWLLGSIDSVDYLLGKTTVEFRQEEFIQEYAEEIVKQYLDDGSITVNQAENILEHMEDYDWDPDQWPYAWRDNSDVDEIPDATDWDGQTLCQVVALQTFCRLYRAETEQSVSTAKNL